MYRFFFLWAGGGELLKRHVGISSGHGAERSEASEKFRRAPAATPGRPSDAAKEARSHTPWCGEGRSAGVAHCGGEKRVGQASKPSTRHLINSSQC